MRLDIDLENTKQKILDQEKKTFIKYIIKDFIARIPSFSAHLPENLILF